MILDCICPSHGAFKQDGYLLDAWQATGKNYLIFQGLQLIFCLTRWPSLIYKQMLMQEICANVILAACSGEAWGMQE